MWEYNSPIGKMLIYIDNQVGKYALRIENIVYGHYSSAVAAADDVYTFSTGCFEWDQHCADADYMLNTPTDIYEWTKIR